MFSVLAKNISTALNNGQRRRTMLVVMVAIKPSSKSRRTTETVF
jgi:hypothetical protein